MATRRKQRRIYNGHNNLSAFQIFLKSNNSMSYKILRSYLTPDIVDYCVMPYLMPLEEEIKENRLNLRREFILVTTVTMMSTLKIAGEGDMWSNVVKESLRGKYYEANNWMKGIEYGRYAKNE